MNQEPKTLEEALAVLRYVVAERDGLRSELEELRASRKEEIRSAIENYKYSVKADAMGWDY